MNKKEMAKKIARDTGYTETAVKDILQSALNEIVNEVSNGEKVRLHPLGTFFARLKAERKARNPKTGETVIVPERRVVEFLPSGLLKDKLKEGL